MTAETDYPHAIPITVSGHAVLTQCLGFRRESDKQSRPFPVEQWPVTPEALERAAKIRLSAAWGKDHDKVGGKRPAHKDAAWAISHALNHHGFIDRGEWTFCFRDPSAEYVD